MHLLRIIVSLFLLFLHFFKKYLYKEQSYNPAATQQINVSPGDGDCFLHSVSVAVWGARDSQNSLRDLMAKNMKKSLNFKTRWLSRRTKDYHLLKKSQQKVCEKFRTIMIYILSLEDCTFM